MKKKIIIIYFLVHLFLIFSISIISILRYYKQNQKNYKNDLLIIQKFQFLISIFILKEYTIITGINTSYGFYGINVATEKYFEVELYDINKIKIKSDIFLNNKTTNGYLRITNLASRMANFIEETNQIKLKKMANLNEIIVNNEIYILKIFKWLGKKEAEKNINCKYYKVRLHTINPVPVNIWEKNIEKKINSYVIKEMEFIVQ